MALSGIEMQALGKKLKEVLPKGKGFSLIVFDFGDGLREFQYISNGQREDMITSLDALLTKWKNQRDANN